MSSIFTAGSRPGAFFRGNRRNPFQVVRILCGVVATVAAMSATVQFLLYPPAALLQANRPNAASPASQWVEIVKPFALFAMPTVMFGSETQSYAARRHVRSGERVDALTYGGMGPGFGNWLYFEIHRGENRVFPTAIPFFAEMARLAAKSGSSVQRAALTSTMVTRFGPMEAGDLQLTKEGHFAACLGFRFRTQDPAIAIGGIACGSPADPVDRAALACAIDRLDLAASGEDRALGKFFARTELNRGRNCKPGRSARRTLSPPWLAASATAPALKGTLAALKPGE